MTDGCLQFIQKDFGKILNNHLISDTSKVNLPYSLTCLALSKGEPLHFNKMDKNKPFTSMGAWIATILMIFVVGIYRMSNNIQENPLPTLIVYAIFATIGFLLGYGIESLAKKILSKKSVKKYVYDSPWSFLGFGFSIATFIFTLAYQPTIEFKSATISGTAGAGLTIPLAIVAILFMVVMGLIFFRRDI